MKAITWCIVAILGCAAAFSALAGAEERTASAGTNDPGEGPFGFNPREMEQTLLLMVADHSAVEAAAK
jgi:hypothetical protein